MKKGTKTWVSVRVGRMGKKEGRKTLFLNLLETWVGQGGDIDGEFRA